MKKVLSLLILTLVIVSCKSESKSDLPPNTYQINVSAKGVYNGMRAYIKQSDAKGRQIAIDTAIVMNETFSFEGNIKTPSIKVITIDGQKSNIPFVLESGVTSIVVDSENLGNSTINGPENNQKHQLYITERKKRNQEITDLNSEISTAMQNDDSELYKELNAKRLELTNELSEYAFEFIKQHPDSDFSLILLESLLATRVKNYGKYKESLDLLAGVINKTNESKLIGQKIATFVHINEQKANVKIGKIAPDFSAPTPDGEMLSLNDIKGKATIIDFWASWCRPCRIENPNVVKVYEKYHDKGLEIISVSLDKNGQKNRWLKAIEDDNLQWHHVSNLKYWNEPVAKMYNVTSIPATFILDENGKIVAKKLRGQALENKIAELLD